MAKNKETLLKELSALGVTAAPEATNKDLEKLLEEAQKKNPKIEQETTLEETPETEKEEEAPSASEEEVEPKLESSETEAPAPVVEDYLRQYQYRKDTKPGSIDSDPQPGSKAAIMKAKLLAQHRVRIIIPRGQGEPKSIDHSVNLNGYRLDFPKNVYIDMPTQIADVIMDSQQQTEAAIVKGQISGDKSKENALI